MDISVISRNTQGVRLINLVSKDKVYDITYVPAEPDDSEIDKEVEELTKDAQAPKHVVTDESDKYEDDVLDNDIIEEDEDLDDTEEITED